MKPLHYWRIHARVCRRIWTDLPDRLRHIIASDSEHKSEEYKWFEAKCEADATKLFEDPSYYDNNEFSFRVSRNEPILKEAA